MKFFITSRPAPLSHKDDISTAVAAVGVGQGLSFVSDTFWYFFLVLSFFALQHGRDAGCLNLALPELPNQRAGQVSAPHFPHHPEGMAELSHGSPRGRTCCLAWAPFTKHLVLPTESLHSPACPCEGWGKRSWRKRSRGEKPWRDSEEQGSLLEGKQTSRTNSRKTEERKGEISIRSMHSANPAQPPVG